MNHTHHCRHQHRHHTAARGSTKSLNAAALRATIHCLSGCAVGEILGMVIGTAFGLSNGATIVMAVVLAFTFGYAFTLVPLFRSGLSSQAAAKVALAADTASITLMEIVDNALMVAIPEGALRSRAPDQAPLTGPEMLELH